jgi:hypothetical protein
VDGTSIPFFIFIGAKEPPVQPPVRAVREDVRHVAAKVSRAHLVPPRGREQRTVRLEERFPLLPVQPDEAEELLREDVAFGDVEPRLSPELVVFVRRRRKLPETAFGELAELVVFL